MVMSEQPQARGNDKISRRDFLKLLAAAGTVLTFTPFVDWGKFLPNPSGSTTEKSKVELPDGSQANVKTFKVNHSEAIIYPISEDPALNKEAFRTWQFIRLPLNWGEIRTMLQPFGSLAWFAYIFGVYGSIGPVRDEKGVNVHVMGPSMTL